MKKACALTAALLLLPLFAACGGETAAQPPAGADTAAVTETTAEETTAPYTPDLPDRDFEGVTFTFLTKGDGYTDWKECSVYAEAENGDVVNDAIYRRNRAVEEEFNVAIAETRSDTLGNEAIKSIAAGDSAYDVLMPTGLDSGTLAAGGYLIDFASVPYIDLTRAWWDQRSIADCSVANRLFYVSSELSFLNNDATWCTMFSKGLIEDYKLESPYDLVAENKWTWDNVYSMYKVVSADLDGDGVLGPDDLYPNLTQNENFDAMYIGDGEWLIRKDGDDLPQIALGVSERSVNVLEQVNQIMNDTQFSFNYHVGASKLGYHLWTTQMFEEGRGLMWVTNLQIVIRLRYLESSFGIVPVPKYSSEQEHYSNVVWMVGSFVTVPKTTGDAERTGILLEALAAKSLEMLRPAYYDAALTGKYLRDEESVEMLDIIIAERVYDLGLAFNWGSIYRIPIDLLKTNSADIASAMASNSSKIQAEIDKTVSDFKALG